MNRTILKLARPINEIEIDLEENTLEAEGYIKVVRCGNCAKRGKGIPDGCPFGMTDDTCDPNAYCSYGVLSHERACVDGRGG